MANQKRSGLLGLTLVLLALSAGPSHAQRQVSRSDSGNFCLGCHSIVSFISNFNSSHDRHTNREVVTNFCELHYPASTDFQQGPCPFFVEGFFYVVDNLDPAHHCDQIGACGGPPSELGAPPVELGGASNVVCNFCEQMVEFTQQSLDNPKTVELVRRQIDAACDYLVVIGQEKQCKQVAHRYLNQAIDFIRHIDPLAYCKSIQLCPPKASARSLGSPRQLPTLTDFNNFGIETSVLVGGYQKNNRPAGSQVSYQVVDTDLAQASHRDGPGCALCKVVVQEMFHFIKDNRTEANIMRGLDRVCKLVYKHGLKLDQCESMVKAYTRELIQLLIDETDPELVCMLLEQCKYDNRQPALLASGRALMDIDRQQNKRHGGLAELMKALEPSVGLHSARACLECKLFLKFFKNELENPQSEDSARKWLLENLCNRLEERTVIDSCTKMVNDYSDTFFKALAGSIDEKHTCVDLGVCQERPAHALIVNALTGQLDPWNRKPASQHQPAHYSGFIASQATFCEQCIDIVSKIDEYLSSHTVDQDVSAVVDQVCKKLPSESLVNECTFLVKTFGNELIDVISSMNNPREVCSKAYLCSAN